MSPQNIIHTQQYSVERAQYSSTKSSKLTHGCERIQAAARAGGRCPVEAGCARSCPCSECATAAETPNASSGETSASSASSAGEASASSASSKRPRSSSSPKRPAPGSSPKRSRSSCSPKRPRSNAVTKCSIDRRRCGPQTRSTNDTGCSQPQQKEGDCEEGYKVQVIDQDDAKGPDYDQEGQEGQEGKEGKEDQEDRHETSKSQKEINEEDKVASQNGSRSSCLHGGRCALALFMHAWMNETARNRCCEDATFSRRESASSMSSM